MIKIATTQPAFYVNTDGKLQIKVLGNNFIYNKYVLKIRDGYTNAILGSLTEDEGQFSLTERIFTGNTSSPLNIGQYYKFQLEYNNELSTVGVAKYIGKQPESSYIICNNGEDGFILTFGLYPKTDEVSETSDGIEEEDKGEEQPVNIEVLKTATFYFNGITVGPIYSKDGNTVTCTQPYKIFAILEGDWIPVTVTYTTYSGLESSLVEENGIQVNNMIELNTEPYNNSFEVEENERGYIKIHGTNVKRKEKTVGDYEQWVTLQSNDNIVIDKNIVFGQEYEYFYTDMEQNQQHIIHKPVYFDSIFLSDKNSNYAIKFNSKISNFKDKRQETKVDTIGSQYPFIFRNEIIKYKEFALSGLISYLADYTLATDNAIISTDFTTSLTAENIYKERIYREQLLTWLSNGEAKLFKSPTEGTMIVRLMDISLTPEDKLGRMIYSFSANVVEIAEYTYENLKKFNLI